MPSLNEIIHASMRQRGGYSPYAKMKREHQAIISECIAAVHKNPDDIPSFNRVRLTFKFYEKNSRRDPDNVAAGGHKFILDAMVNDELIPDDTGKHIISWVDEFYIDKEAPRIEVIVESCPDDC
jgi:hypothetical protein